VSARPDALEQAPAAGSQEPLHDWIELTTVGDLLVRAAARRGDADALVFPEARQRYAELLASSERFAASLAGLGVERGDTVAVLMPNCLDYAHALFGCALLGARALLVNARYKEHELSYVLRDADAVAILTTDLVSEYVDFVPVIERAIADPPPPLRHRIMLGASSPEGFLDRSAFDDAADSVPVEDVHRRRRAVRVRDTVVLMYTSGTTAEPKGCLISHESLARTALGIVERFDLTEDEKFWDPLPLFHMAGLLLFLSNMTAGGTFMSMTHFEPGAALRQMEAEGCTFAYPCFPTITQSILRHPDYEGTDLGRVRALLDTAPPATLREIGRRIPQAVVLTSYGLTEGGGVVAFSHLDDPERERTDTGGRPFRGMEVRIADPDSDEDVPIGEVGQILVRGPGIFDGYNGDPVRTAEVMRGGWLHTGDLGRIDGEGRIAYVGRSKDMLKVGGENVAALEIEAFLGSHPDVKIVQVVGVPDEKYLEVPAAFVELDAGSSVTEEDLIGYCRGTIAAFKVPRYVRFVTEWPMSATKIQKHRLREELLVELGLDTSSS
jgi:fatty-acyl-CoA synthase